MCNKPEAKGANMSWFPDPTERKKASDAKPEEVKKHQAVFHLDFDTWEGLIEAFDIRQSIIPHRQPDPMAQASASGWYA